MKKTKKTLVIFIVLIVIPILFLSINSSAAKIEIDPIAEHPLTYSKKRKDI